MSSSNRIIREKYALTLCDSCCSTTGRFHKNNCDSNTLSAPRRRPEEPSEIHRARRPIRAFFRAFEPRRGCAIAVIITHTRAAYTVVLSVEQDRHGYARRRGRRLPNYHFVVLARTAMPRERVHPLVSEPPRLAVANLDLGANVEAAY